MFFSLSVLPVGLPGLITTRARVSMPLLGSRGVEWRHSRARAQQHGTPWHTGASRQMAWYAPMGIGSGCRGHMRAHPPDHRHHHQEARIYMLSTWHLGQELRAVVNFNERIGGWLPCRSLEQTNKR